MALIPLWLAWPGVTEADCRRSLLSMALYGRDGYHFTRAKLAESFHQYSNVCLTFLFYIVVTISFHIVHKAGQGVLEEKEG